MADIAKGKGNLRGLSGYVADGGRVGTCKWTFKWTSTSDPGVATACP